MKSGNTLSTPRTFSGLRVKQKEIIPKPTKLLQDRVKHSKQKRYGDEECQDDRNKQDDIRASFDDVVLKNEKCDEIFHQQTADLHNTRTLSGISVSTHSHVDLEENILSVHSPRPLPSVKNDARSQDAQSNRIQLLLKVIQHLSVVKQLVAMIVSQKS